MHSTCDTLVHYITIHYLTLPYLYNGLTSTPAYLHVVLNSRSPEQIWFSEDDKKKAMEKRSRARLPGESLHCTLFPLRCHARHPITPLTSVL